MERIGPILDGVMENLGIKPRLERENLVLLWGDAVGERIASNAQAVGCRGATLLVEVKNSAWLQELSLMRDDLIGRLNQVAGKRVLEGITFYLERR